MSENNTCGNFEKFLALPEEKRERIINAAMKEFLVGYKNASTDNIVREAGISKGLLFHYFGTKENLHNFLIDYSVETIHHEYIDLIHILQPDILESVWQLTLLKRDLSEKYPDIFDFMASAYTDKTVKSEINVDKMTKLHAIQAKILADVYSYADDSLFRNDIDAKTAKEIVSWTLNGYAQSKANLAPGETLGQTARENYDSFLEEFQQILNTLRTCFYK